MPAAQPLRRRGCPRRPTRRLASRRLQRAEVHAASQLRCPACDIGTSRRHCAVAGSCTPSTHQPPSRAMPSTAPTRHSVDAHCAIRSAVTCGVSIPICRIGSPCTATAASACAFASRSAKSSPRCSMTVNSASRLRISALRAAASKSPVIATTRAATGAPATASRVSSNAAAATSAAARTPMLAARRVLANPGTGAFATTSTATSDHEIARQKSKAAMKLPRTEPLTLDFPPVRGPYVTSRSMIRQFAAPARINSSNGYPDLRSVTPRASTASRRATRIGAMSCTGTPWRVRSRQHTAALPSRACHGQPTPAPLAADRRPCPRRDRVRRPGRGALPDPVDPSPSRTATSCVVAATMPACTAAP